MKPPATADHLPELNLYNFEEDEFVGSKYVLTSPRSLEACDMLNVKPMDLIYKPLSDFQDEMKSKGLRFQDAYTEYDRYEKRRQKNLRECRDYRDKMIRDNIFNQPDIALDPTNNIDFDLLLLHEHVVPHPQTSSSKTPYTSNREALPYRKDPLPLQNNVNVSAPVESAWRSRPPYSERHLSSYPSQNGHTFHHNASNPPYQSNTTSYESGFTRFRSQPADVDDKSYPLSTVSDPTRYKSSFMRKKLGLESENTGSHMSSHAPRTRSYTLGCLQDKLLNRTSTPLDAAAGRESAIDRAFNRGLTVDPISPRLSTFHEETAAAPRRRTASADSCINNEIHRLRQIKQDPRNADLNVTGRSLSLTDLTANRARHSCYPVEGDYRYSIRTQGYSSDSDYYTADYQSKSKPSQNHCGWVSGGYGLSEALDMRQRQIEDDMRAEELRYRHQLDELKRDLDNMKTTESRFHREVDELGEQLEANRWKKYYYSQENSDYIKQRERDIPKYYVGETLADRTQRERQLQLENQIADAQKELAEAKLRSQKSKLHSHDWKRAFDKALDVHELRWRDSNTKPVDTRPVEENNRRENKDTGRFPLSAEELKGYEHISEILRKSLNSSGSPSRPPLVNGSQPHEEKEAEFDRLRASLRRDETPLTEQAVARHVGKAPKSPPDEPEELELQRDDLSTPRYNNHDVTAYSNGYHTGGGPRVFNDDLHDQEHYMTRPRKPVSNGHHHSSNSRRERPRVAHRDRDVIDDRVAEMKANLEERRRKLNEKLQLTSRQTEELRAARLEAERRERLRRQEKSNRRILRECRSNKRDKTRGDSKPNKAPIVEKVRPMKCGSGVPHRSRSYERDSFDKKVLKAELTNWVNTGQRSRSRTRSANRNESQFVLA